MRPDEFDGRDEVPVTTAPDDIEIIVAGGEGGHSAIIRPWGFHSQGVVKPVTDTEGNRLSCFDASTHH